MNKILNHFLHLWVNIRFENGLYDDGVKSTLLHIENHKQRVLTFILCLHPYTSITTRFLHRVILTLECQGRFLTHKTYINEEVLRYRISKSSNET